MARRGTTHRGTTHRVAAHRLALLPGRLRRDTLGALARHHQEGQAWPRHQHVEPPPNPYRLVENLQHQLADVAGADHFAVSPPGQGRNFVEAADAFHAEAFGLHQLTHRTVAVAPFMPGCGPGCHRGWARWEP